MSEDREHSQKRSIEEIDKVETSDSERKCIVEQNTPNKRLRICCPTQVSGESIIIDDEINSFINPVMSNVEIINAINIPNTNRVNNDNPYVCDSSSNLIDDGDIAIDSDEETCSNIESTSTVMCGEHFSDALSQLGGEDVLSSVDSFLTSSGELGNFDEASGLFTVESSSRAVISKIDIADGESLNSRVDSDECPICLGKLTREIGSPDVCEHVFCLGCITEWSKRENTCPVDRLIFNGIEMKLRNSTIA